MAMPKTSEVYKKLYHYTTWDGLYGILNKNKSLWATHCNFLNDYSEIVFFKSKLIEFLLPHVLQKTNELIVKSSDIKKMVNEKGGSNAVAKHEIKILVNAIYKATGYEFYIASFCGEHKEDEYINQNGLLSQWRGYGRDGGFALVFDTLKLEKILQSEYSRFAYIHFFLADVIYSGDEEKFKDELSEPMDDITNHVIEMIHNMALGKDEPPDAEKAYPAFVQCISRYKHQGFKEENEVRIVAYPDDAFQEKQEKEQKFREKNGEWIPYIELFNSPDILLPIEKIIVGPHKEKEARASALRIMLRNTGIDVTVSDIPYIGS